MNTTDSSRPIGIRLGAAVVALAAMSLAAGCGSSKSSGTKHAAGTSSTTTSAAASSSSSASSPGAVDGGASPSAAGSGSTPLPPKPTTPGPGGPRDCSTDMLSFKIEALREPINHVLIYATNTSRLPCYVNKYPMLRTLLTQTAIIKAADATKPAGPVLLAPGATAYAGVTTSAGDGSGAAGRKVSALELQLQPGGPDGVGRPKSVQMPTDAQYIDATAVVTYWESDVNAAADY